jgi:predicted PurR-regulated permease PerM
MYEVISITGVVLFVLIVVVSVWANVFLIRKLLYFTENINKIDDSIDSFINHLEELYELPLFYGDENLKQLIEHSKQLGNQLKGFREMYKE